MWAVQDNGDLLSLTYMKEHQIWGWARHTTEGRFTQVVSIPGDNSDSVYATVVRTINGVDKYFLERMQPYWDRTKGIENTFYVDSGLIFSFEEDVSEVSGLQHLEGHVVNGVIDGKAFTGLTVTEGKIQLPFSGKHIITGLPYIGELEPVSYTHLTLPTKA